MKRLVFLSLCAASLFAADDPWVKVKELKSRAELRIYKKGASDPVNAVFFDATDDKVIVVVKNTQIAVMKDDIDRLDARPLTRSTRTVTKHSETTVTQPDYTPHPPVGGDKPTENWSSGLSISGSGKPDFETIYKRPAATPKWGDK